MNKFSGLALNVGATSRLTLLNPVNRQPIHDKDGKAAPAATPGRPAVRARTKPKVGLGVECGHPLGTALDLRPATVGAQSLSVFDAFS